MVWEGTLLNPATGSLAPPQDVYRRLWAGAKSKHAADVAAAVHACRKVGGTGALVPWARRISWGASVTGLPDDVVERLGTTDVQMRERRAARLAALAAAGEVADASAAGAMRSSAVAFSRLTAPDAISELVAEIAAADAAGPSSGGAGQSAAETLASAEPVEYYLRRQRQPCPVRRLVIELRAEVG